MTDQRRVSAMARGQRRLGTAELTSILALSIALTALGIDLMLPAFGAIRSDLGLPADSTAVAGLVTAYFVGLAVGQLGYGPLSDRFGRRPALYVGYGVYATGALAAAVSPTLPLLLVSRFVWGLGAAGPRVVTQAIIRDTYEGERMARAMSFVMAVFILVPVVAPTIGAAISAVVSWRWLFWLCLLAAVGMSVWAARLPETLREEHRLDLSVERLAGAARFVVTNRQTVAYTFALTALYGVFLSYLASSEIIIGRTFGRPSAFPYIFGGLALVMGGAMLVNASIVGRIGMRRVAHGVLLVYVVLGGAMAGLALATDGRPPLPLFLVGLAGMLASHALLIPNFNTLAMVPMRPVAGTASSVLGATQIAVGAGLAAIIDQAFDGTVVPISLGFLGYGVVALVLVVVAERGRLFGPMEPPPADLPPAPPAEA